MIETIETIRTLAEKILDETYTIEAELQQLSAAAEAGAAQKVEKIKHILCKKGGKVRYFRWKNKRKPLENRAQ